MVSLSRRLVITEEMERGRELKRKRTETKRKRMRDERKPSHRKKKE